MVRKAFSLIEICLTLLIVWVLFAVALPKLSFFNQFILQNEVNKFLGVLTFLQQTAIATNQDQELFLDLQKNSYFYLKENEKGKNIECRFPKVVIFGFLPTAKGPPATPTETITKPITFPKTDNNVFKITLFADGNITPGTVYFIDKDKKNMMAITCAVSQVSCIRKYKYQSGNWVCLK